MARAGMAQAEIVRSNIVSMIKGNQRLRTYTPDPIEGVLKLTLGKVSPYIALLKSPLLMIFLF